MKVRILEDYVAEDDESPAIEPGTIVDATVDPENGDAWYIHPTTGEEWFSFSEDWEAVYD